MLVISHAVYFSVFLKFNQAYTQRFITTARYVKLVMIMTIVPQDPNYYNVRCSEFEGSEEGHTPHSV